MIHTNIYVYAKKKKREGGAAMTHSEVKSKNINQPLKTESTEISIRNNV